MCGALRLGPVALVLALYFSLAFLFVRDVGVVGEVAAAWLPGAPMVAVDLGGGQATWSGPPHEPHAGHWLGPLMARQTRPVEELRMGAVSLPLAVNVYTGGPPEWPGAILMAAGGGHGALVILHTALGAIIMLVAWRFLALHAGRAAAAACVLYLATDWSFHFYRKALGGTELLLHGALLLLLWALWGRRWSGGRHGAVALALALGLGLLAKVTFLATAAAFGLAALLTRWDRAPTKAPAPIRPVTAVVVLLLCTAPLWLAALHGALGFPDSPRVVSHDQLSLQTERALAGLEALAGGGALAAREPPTTLLAFLVQPLDWFRHGLGVEAAGQRTWALRALGWATVIIMAVSVWRRREAGPSVALARFLTLALPLQILFLWLANRDLHHLAQATPTMAVLVGLTADRLAGRLAHLRSPGRIALATVFVLPWALAGVSDLARTDPLLARSPVRTFTSTGQGELAAFLRANGVRSLWASDYDLYGMLEVVAPEIHVRHAWGAASRRAGDHPPPPPLPDVLRAAEGGHYLVVRPSAPMIYNLSPGWERLQAAATEADVHLQQVATLEDGGDPWAWLYRVAPAGPAPLLPRRPPGEYSMPVLPASPE